MAGNSFYKPKKKITHTHALQYRQYIQKGAHQGISNFCVMFNFLVFIILYYFIYYETTTTINDDDDDDNNNKEGRKKNVKNFSFISLHLLNIHLQMQLYGTLIGTF